MTRAQVLDRVRAELTAWEESGEDAATLEDLDVLEVAITVAMDECWEWIDAQGTRPTAKES